MNVTVENFVGVFDDVYSPEYCSAVIDYFEMAQQKGLGLTRQMQDPNTAKTIKDDMQIYAHSEVGIHYTDNLINTFNSVFWANVYPEYANKFSILKTHSPHTNYAFKVQKTEVGQGYHVWHAENTSRESTNRLLTWILYLNDVEEGGETEFLYYPKRIKPKTGRLILWPAGFTHTHRGNPPISNTKYVVTGWLEY